MTQDEIIEMAKQVYGTDKWNVGQLKRLEAFAKLVAAAEHKRVQQFYTDAATGSVKAAIEYEREACAKVCELESGDGPDNGCCPTFWNEAQEACAAAIRARGAPTSRGET